MYSKRHLNRLRRPNEAFFNWNALGPKLWTPNSAPESVIGVKFQHILVITRSYSTPKNERDPSSRLASIKAFPKIGAMGPLRPHKSPVRGRSCPNLPSVFPLPMGMCEPNFTAIVQSWLIPSHRTQHCEPHNSPLGKGGLLCGGVSVVQGYVVAKNELDPQNHLAAIHTLCRNWGSGAL